jgi:hypothetical protein
VPLTLKYVNVSIGTIGYLKELSSTLALMSNVSPAPRKGIRIGLTRMAARSNERLSHTRGRPQTTFDLIEVRGYGGTSNDTIVSAADIGQRRPTAMSRSGRWAQRGEFCSGEGLAAIVLTQAGLRSVPALP